MYGETRRKMQVEKIHRQRLQCLCKKFFRGKGKMYERLFEALNSLKKLHVTRLRDFPCWNK